MKREEVLDTAKSLVCGERAKQYAPPKKNFQRIANMWSEILGVKVTPAQVALCMAAVKITRLIEDDQHKDSWIDLAGYASCGAEASEKEGNLLKPGEVVRVELGSISHWGVQNDKH